MAQRTGEILQSLGAEVWFEEVLPDRPNVIGRFPADRPGKPRVLLCPHTDTVSVGGMTVDPFGAEVRDGKIYGRGSCDTKGTMASMLAALEHLGPEGIASLNAEVWFAGFMAEETGQWGSRDFAERYRGQFAFAIAGEPTGCRVVHTHKGSDWIQLNTTGIAVHGSTPERGENAVMKMVPVLQALDTDFRRMLASPQWHHPVLGDSTLNIGIIRGGSRTNIVPDACKVWLDIRFTPGLHQHGSERFLREFLHHRGFGDSVTLSRESPLCPPLDTPADSPFVQKLAAAGHGLTGAPWFCDAAWLFEIGGIAAVAAGPGSIDQAHTADEWVSIDALEEGTRFYADFLRSL